ncbi:Uncharacterised protein [Actinomadura madurae]|nr:Uncharacterised protein [Actinomadura madurae]
MLIDIALVASLSIIVVARISALRWCTVLALAE